MELKRRTPDEMMAYHAEKMLEMRVEIAELKEKLESKDRESRWLMAGVINNVNMDILHKITKFALENRDKTIIKEK